MQAIGRIMRQSPEERKFLKVFGSLHLSFNQPLNEWNVSNVTNVEGMFLGARSFNQPLNEWNVSNVNSIYSNLGIIEPI